MSDSLVTQGVRESRGCQLSADVARSQRPETTEVDPHPGGDRDEAPRGGAVRAGQAVRRFLDQWAPVATPGFLGRLFGFSPLAPHSGPHYREAATEHRVAEIIGELGDGWWVAHGISMCGDEAPASRDDISHVIIGDRGAFSLTVVNPEGRSAWVSGHAFVHAGVRMAHLRDAEFNALRLSQQLYEQCGVRAEVRPAVVVANPRRLIVDRPPPRVAVLRPRELTTWMRSHPVALSVEERAVLAGAAAALADGGESGFARLLARFSELHHRVVQARHRRLWWLAAALTALWVGLVAATGLAQLM